MITRARDMMVARASRFRLPGGTSSRWWSVDLQLQAAPGRRGLLQVALIMRRVVDCRKVATMNKFRVGITRDFLHADGTLSYGDIGLALLDQPQIEREFLIGSEAEIPPDVADQYDALLVLAPRVSERTVAGCQRLGLVARFGVGYDTVDVPACTRHD